MSKRVKNSKSPRVHKTPLRAGEWVPQGGKTRGFVNIRSGERISRRQFDKLHGRLKEQGFSSYEKKAKASKLYTPLEYKVRPRRGHKTGRMKYSLAQPKTETAKAKSQLQPLINFQRVQPPRKGFHKFYTLPYQEDSLRWFLQTVRKNKKVYCVGIPNLTMVDDMGKAQFSHRVMPCTMFDELPNTAELWALIQSSVDSAGNVSDMVVTGINVNITFKGVDVKTWQANHG